MRLGNGLILRYKLRGENGFRTIDEGEIEQDDEGGLTVRRPDGSTDVLAWDMLSEWEVGYISPQPPW